MTTNLIAPDHCTNFWSSYVIDIENNKVLYCGNLTGEHYSKFIHFISSEYPDMEIENVNGYTDRTELARGLIDEQPKLYGSGTGD